MPMMFVGAPDRDLSGGLKLTRLSASSTASKNTAFISLPVRARFIPFFFYCMLTSITANDRDLKRRIRKVPGVPIMGVTKGKYAIERLPGAPAT